MNTDDTGITSIAERILDTSKSASVPSRRCACWPSEESRSAAGPKGRCRRRPPTGQPTPSGEANDERRHDDADGAQQVASGFQVGAFHVEALILSVSVLLLLIFAAGVLVDAARRYFTGSDPIGMAMMVMAVVAAGVNLWSLVLLKRLKQPDVNLRAATTFSFNDFISNGGILVGGGLVLWLGQSWPDLVVAVGIAVIAFKGGIDILRDAHREAKHQGTPRGGSEQADAAERLFLPPHFVGKQPQRIGDHQ